MRRCVGGGCCGDGAGPEGGTGDASGGLRLRTGDGGGVLDQGQSIREAVGADGVWRGGEYARACGIGCGMAAEAATFASNACNVVAAANDRVSRVKS